MRAVPDSLTVATIPLSLRRISLLQYSRTVKTKVVFGQTWPDYLQQRMPNRLTSAPQQNSRSLPRKHCVPTGNKLTSNSLLLNCSRNPVAFSPCTHNLVSRTAALQSIHHSSGCLTANKRARCSRWHNRASLDDSRGTGQRGQTISMHETRILAHCNHSPTASAHSKETKWTK